MYIDSGINVWRSRRFFAFCCFFLFFFSFCLYFLESLCRVIAIYIDDSLYFMRRIQKKYIFSIHISIEYAICICIYIAEWHILWFSVRKNFVTSRLHLSRSSSCFSLSITLVFSPQIDSFIVHPIVFFLQRTFCHKYILYSLCINVWSLNGINIILFLVRTLVYYFFLVGVGCML